MALKIFETDPEAQSSGGSSDIVGRFRSGMAVNGKPLALTEWRLTTADPDVADKIAALYGGEVEEWDSETEPLQVLTDCNEFAVLLEAPGAITSSMVQWGKKGLLRKCDGMTQLGVDDDDEDKGAPCVCPASFNDRKAAAKTGKGCDPSIGVYFHLADDPEMGKFKFFSGSWTMAKDIVPTEAKLATMEGIVHARMGLEVVEWTTRQGEERKFTKPYVKLDK